MMGRHSFWATEQEIQENMELYIHCTSNEKEKKTAAKAKKKEHIKQKKGSKTKKGAKEKKKEQKERPNTTQDQNKMGITRNEKKVRKGLTPATYPGCKALSRPATTPGRRGQAFPP